MCRICINTQDTLIQPHTSSTSTHLLYNHTPPVQSHTSCTITPPVQSHTSCTTTRLGYNHTPPVHQHTFCTPNTHAVQSAATYTVHLKLTNEHRHYQAIPCDTHINRLQKVRVFWDVASSRLTNSHPLLDENCQYKRHKNQEEWNRQDDHSQNPKSANSPTAHSTMTYDKRQGS